MFMNQPFPNFGDNGYTEKEKNEPTPDWILEIMDGALKIKEEKGELTDDDKDYLDGKIDDKEFTKRNIETVKNNPANKQPDKGGINLQKAIDIVKENVKAPSKEDLDFYSKIKENRLEKSDKIFIGLLIGIGVYFGLSKL